MSVRSRLTGHQRVVYADLLTAAQELPPAYVYVVAPWSEFANGRCRSASATPASPFESKRRSQRTDISAARLWPGRRWRTRTLIRLSTEL
jgi:hypothetical protein